MPIFIPTDGGGGSGVPSTGGSYTVSPATGQINWVTRTRLAAPVDGTLQILNNANGNTVGQFTGMGVQFGTSDANGAIITLGVGQLYVVDGTRSTNYGFNARSFGVSNTASTTASYHGAGTNEANVGIGFDDTSASDGWSTHIGHRYIAQPKTASYTVLRNDSGASFSNEAAAAAIIFTLPAATLSSGIAAMQYYFTHTNATAANGIKLQAIGTDKIYFGTSVSAAGGTQTTVVTGSSVHLVCTAAGIWSSIGGIAGTWTTP